MTVFSQESKYCEICKWWQHSTAWVSSRLTGKSYNECVRQEHDGSLFVTQGEENYDSWLLTLPHFGCVQWEEGDATGSD